MATSAGRLGSAAARPSGSLLPSTPQLTSLPAAAGAAWLHPGGTARPLRLPGGRSDRTRSLQRGKAAVFQLVCSPQLFSPLCKYKAKQDC